jgi:hypothetical protein
MSLKVDELIGDVCSLADYELDDFKLQFYDKFPPDNENNAEIAFLNDEYDTLQEEYEIACDKIEDLKAELEKFKEKHNES